MWDEDQKYLRTFGQKGLLKKLLRRSSCRWNIVLMGYEMVCAGSGKRQGVSFCEYSKESSSSIAGGIFL